MFQAAMEAAATFLGLHFRDKLACMSAAAIPTSAATCIPPTGVANWLDVFFPLDKIALLRKILAWAAHRTCILSTRMARTGTLAYSWGGLIGSSLVDLGTHTPRRYPPPRSAFAFFMALSFALSASPPHRRSHSPPAAPPSTPPQREWKVKKGR